jgi:hypothetical protein
MTKLTRVSILTTALLAALLAVAVPAQAAGVTNGGFETGTLAGWTATTESEDGGWTALSGTTPPRSGEFNSVPAPFEGSWDAVADEEERDSMILYQEVALTPGVSHELSLELNYLSDASSLLTPEPDTLSATGEPNQQVRVDVMKAGSPVSSLESADVLVPVFATSDDSPKEIGWTHLTANLTPYAGQTVRIRIVDVNNRGNLLVGVDAVSITDGAETVTPPIVTPTPIAAPAPVASCKVPKLGGKKLRVAKKQLGAADCKLGKVKKKKGVTAKSGKVVKQSPKAGTVETAGSKVSLKLG